jgi:hypothetical protein
MKLRPPSSKLSTLTCQLNMPLDTPDTPALRGLSRADRSVVVARLATLLITAAGVAEATDDAQ